MFGCTVQLTQEESARNEIEAKLLATSNTLKEAQSAFDTERTQKDQELAQLKDEVNNLLFLNKCHLFKNNKLLFILYLYLIISTC